MKATLIQGDCVEVLRGMEAGSVDAVVTDPPAGIGFMSTANRRWDDPRSFAGDGSPRTRFVAFLTAVFRECVRVLKPGGHAIVWALPRTAHWTAWAMEDAGFDIRDCGTYLFHVQAQGFPKGTDISKAIDRMAGVEREVVGQTTTRRPRASVADDGAIYGRRDDGGDVSDFKPATAPATPDAARWQGWHTALKPAAEFWIVGRAPLSEKTVAGNVLRHGTGALNIAATRVVASVFGRLNDPVLAVRQCVLGSVRRIAAALRSCSSGGTSLSHDGADQGDRSPPDARCAETLARLRFPNASWCAPSAWSVPDSPVGCLACHRSGDALLRRAVVVAPEGALQLADALDNIDSALSTPAHIRRCRCSDADSYLVANVQPLLLSLVEGDEHSIYLARRANGRDGEPSADRRYTDAGSSNFAATPGPRGGDARGRWPPNVVLSHSEGCVRIGTRRVRSGTTYEPPSGAKEGFHHAALQHLGRVVGYADADGLETVEDFACAPGCAVAELDRQSGAVGDHGTKLRDDKPTPQSGDGMFGGGRKSDANVRGVEPGTSRFFPCFKYEAKADRAARAFLCRTCDAVYPSTERDRHRAHDRVEHPTTKPVDLMRWLCRLIGGQLGSVILDPFMGSCSTGVACAREGFRFIGAERDPDYVRIARYRLEEDAPLFLRGNVEGT